MKILPDENLPKKIKQNFPEHEIFTVREKGWHSKKNGELLSLMVSEGFEVLLTFDRNLPYQQNLEKYPIKVIVLVAENNTYEILHDLLVNVKAVIENNIKAGLFWISK
ncbi:MAG: hypothetical protein M3Z92_08765 [Bacteroidota bacterium]|nr:hypothetical protein [Bacteroidota bacterium]